MAKKNSYYKGLTLARRLSLRWLRDRGVTFSNSPKNAKIKDALAENKDTPATIAELLKNASKKSWVPIALEFLGQQVITNKPVKRSPKKMSFTKDPTKQNLKPVWKNFYSSDEWRALRYAAFAAYGRKCGCCGASPETGAVMHVDHIKPRYTHPELALELSNLQILCADCNQGKGAWDSTDWRWKAEEERMDKAFKSTV